MEKLVAEPGAVVAGRVVGQAHDGVPQLGETFRQILHVAGSFACAGARLGQEPAGIGPGSGHGFEIAGRGCGVRVSNIGFLRALQDRMVAMP